MIFLYLNSWKCRLFRVEARLRVQIEATTNSRVSIQGPAPKTLILLLLKASNRVEVSHRFRVEGIPSRS